MLSYWFPIVLCSLFVTYIFRYTDVGDFYFQYAPAMKVDDNNDLAEATKLLEGKIRGPESLAHHKGKLYTGIDDGRLIEINTSNPSMFRTITTIGKKQCGHMGPLSKDCGRILGVFYDYRYGLLLSDAYLGLYAVNVTSGEQTLLWDGHKPIDGKKCMFWNDITVVPDFVTGDTNIIEKYNINSGRIFVTESSSKWNVRQYANMVWDIDGTSRVFEYEMTTGRLTTVCNSLINGNGLVTHWEGDSVLVGETVAARISRCYISGQRKGETEIFLDGLPGYIDNIRRSQIPGEYWIALTAIRKQGDLASYIEKLSMYPKIRKFIFTFIKMWKMLPLKRSKPSKKYGMVLGVNDEGHVTRVLGCNDGQIAGVSHVEAVEEDGEEVLYLGSVQRDYVGRLRV